MSISRKDQESVKAILQRARELAGASQPPPGTAEAETLAALTEGTLSFEQVDDETLERCIHVYGADAVVEALQDGAYARSLAAEPVPIQVPEAARQPARTRPIERGESLGQKIIALWQALQQPAWLAVAATIVALGIVYFTSGTWKRPSGFAGGELAALKWPANQPFDPAAMKPWGLSPTALPTAMPDFVVETVRSGSNPGQCVTCQLATVIVRSAGGGFGSGALISTNGWILTSYHVVSDAAQKAAVAGHVAVFDIITPHLDGNKVQPNDSVAAKLYRADPRHDLALLKLDQLPSGSHEMPCFQLAGQKVQAGTPCVVVGSPAGGRAWLLRHGAIAKQFDSPKDSSVSLDASIERFQATVIVTDTETFPGDEGGPLLNDKGELIGLTVVTPANVSGDPVGWHIGWEDLSNFVANLPVQPEGVPFDPWTAGLPQATMLAPALGHLGSLRYRYSSGIQNGADGLRARPLAETVFVNFNERNQHTDNSVDRTPAGLWGMEDRGQFRFDLFITKRADGVVAAGYTNGKGIVDEIRIGRSDGNATIVWQCDRQGYWHVTGPVRPIPLLDKARLGATNLNRLQASLEQP